MRQDIAMRWADDLDANADKQGRSALNPEPDKFCCLGRLGLLHGTPSEKRTWLSGDTIEWAGMKSVVGAWNTTKREPIEGCSSLAALNDKAEWTFPEIAAFIRENWGAL